MTTVPRETLKAAGILCRTKGGLVLFLRRGPDGDHAGTWAFPGGKAENGEEPIQTAVRECFEETGYQAPAQNLKSLGAAESDGVSFTTFLHEVEEPFEVDISRDDESTHFFWCAAEDAPLPLHPGVKTLLKFLSGNTKSAQDEKRVLTLAADKAMRVVSRETKNLMALDRASVRSFDSNGRLRVEQANISKANVCPYFGEEIPGSEELGLDPKKTYMLLRHPEALALSAASFNGVPILDVHTPSTAWDHPSGKVIGATGTDAVFDGPYLKNSLIFWTGEAIEDIENEKRRELSCGYAYRAEMTPGEYEGVRYDGVMLDIIGNHVALVEAGRAGPDVIVGDSQLEKEKIMTTKKAPALSGMGQLARGALMGALAPVLAADAKLDYNTLLKGVTQKNFASHKTRIVNVIKTKMAADADLTAIVNLLDTLEKAEGVDDMPEASQSAVDMDPESMIMDMLKGCGATDEQVGQAAEAFKRMKPATDADPDKKDEEEKKAEDKEGEEEKVSKGAMDAAIRKASADSAKAVEAAKAETIARMNEVVDAREAVSPVVGKLNGAFDSAEAVYGAALKQMGVKHEGVHPSALRSIFEAHSQAKPQRQAADAKQLATESEGFAERFPGAAGIRVI